MPVSSSAFLRTWPLPAFIIESSRGPYSHLQTGGLRRFLMIPSAYLGEIKVLGT